ncbi:hypothetical protein H2203_002624 [Taxawa tesnikishii (nom. ined.)]|nr:hypothetical protein H2203_002624 [Dothideales sp. JES 119]
MAAAIPENFITGQAPGITIERIDFAKTPLQAYTGLYATILDNVLSAEECHTLLRMAEAQTSGGWERAMVNIGNGKQAMYEDVRSCGRIIWDDMDVVARLWRRVAPLVPEIARLESQAYITGVGPAKRNEVWKLTRLNERMRF